MPTAPRAPKGYRRLKGGLVKGGDLCFHLCCCEGRGWAPSIATGTIAKPDELFVYARKVARPVARGKRRTK